MERFSYRLPAQTSECLRNLAPGIFANSKISPNPESLFVVIGPLGLAGYFLERTIIVSVGSSITL